MSENVCGYAKPPFSIWRWLGFGTCSAPWLDDDEYPDFVVSRLVVEITCKIDWKDRVRLLVSGKMMLGVSIKTDKPIDRSIAFTNLSVLPPVTQMPKAMRRAEGSA